MKKKSLVLILLCIFLLIFLNGCGSHEYASSSRIDPETDPTCEICGLIECDPEPTYFDEYGVQYYWNGGRCDEYFVNEFYRDELKTPESTAISWLAYYPYWEELQIEFRESGDEYLYYGVPYSVWLEFCWADSKGEFFHEYIKERYRYDKIR